MTYTSRTGLCTVALRLAILCTAATLAAGCASSPPGPVVSAEQHITLDAGFDEVWTAAIEVLRGEQMFVHTRDYPSRDRPGRTERGRIEALKPAGKGFLKKYRQRLVIAIAAGPDGERTAVAARVIAETHSVGLLSEPAWREAGTPDPSLADTFLEALRVFLETGTADVPS